MAAKLSADDQGAGPGAAEVDARRAIKSPAIDAKPLVHEQAAARETPSGFGPKAVASTDAAANAMPIAALPAAPIAPRANEVPTQAHVAATVDTPAFAPALATQVRWLVEGGVQHAQLSLNPAEMGPVAVHIAVDGAQARIDFSAEIAGTRSAIESSLPTLAAALTASGLTLAGGGVYDGTPRRPSGQPGSPGRGPVQGEARVDGAPLEAAMTALRSGAPARGLVDLMA